jgi:hypothetical protein
LCAGAPPVKVEGQAGFCANFYNATFREEAVYIAAFTIIVWSFFNELRIWISEVITAIVRYVCIAIQCDFFGDLLEFDGYGVVADAEAGRVNPPQDIGAIV